MSDSVGRGAGPRRLAGGPGPASGRSVPGHPQQLVDPTELRYSSNRSAHAQGYATTQREPRHRRRRSPCRGRAFARGLIHVPDGPWGGVGQRGRGVQAVAEPNGSAPRGPRVDHEGALPRLNPIFSPLASASGPRSDDSGSAARGPVPRRRGEARDRPSGCSVPGQPCEVWRPLLGSSATHVIAPRRPRVTARQA